MSPLPALLWIATLAWPAVGPAGRGGQDGEPSAPVQESIEQAVRRGVDWLLAHQQRDGSWDYESQRYPSGQTALSAYTLIKAGLPLEHPAILRALAFLAAGWPEETYSLGCELMLLEATRDPAWVGRMEALVERLHATDLGGEWGYPLTHSSPNWIPREGRPDLSNTQYAVLGLRAAQHAGVEVPRRVWNDVVDAVLAYQEPPRAADPEQVLGRKVAGRFNVAGFRYLDDGSRGPSGSMTAAGLTVLGVAREVMGERLGPRRLREIEQASAMGLAWLALNWSVEANPGAGGWHKYYLYGLERVGGVLGIEEIGPHTWFEEGTRLLLTSQKDDGSWGADQSETCFAVLFLRRATARVASNVTSGLAPQSFASPAGDPVVLRGLGQPAIALWLDPPSAALSAQYRAGLRVERVEYLVDGEVVAEVAGRPEAVWENERFPARHQFSARGKHAVTASVHLAPAGDGEPRVLTTRGFELDVRYALEDWMLEFAGERARNLLSGTRVDARASSQVTGHEGPAQACDGRQGTRWLAARDDDAPWLRLDLARPVRADRIVLSQATPRELYRNYLSRVAEAELYLNRDDLPLRVVFEQDEMRPTVVTLERPRAISALELRVVSRARGTAWPDLIGIAEVALELAP